MLRDERQSARMSKITNDGLILSGTVGYALWLYPYGIGNSGRQRVKRHRRKYCHFCKKKFRTKTLAAETLPNQTDNPDTAGFHEMYHSF